MNVITTRSSNVSLKMSQPILPVDRLLMKFISIIHGVEDLHQCPKNKELKWLNNKILESEIKFKDVSQYDAFIFPYLHVSSNSSQNKINNRRKIALQYAKILELHEPKKSGWVNRGFSYYELVWTIKTVFKEHILKNVFLSSGGIKIGFLDKCFYAKLENKKIYIFAGAGSLIAQGGFASVAKIYELTTKQFLAFKIANQDAKSIQLVQKEAANLKEMHAKAAFYDLSTKGLQVPPLVTIDCRVAKGALVGFLSQIYGIELRKWCRGAHSNAVRLDMCKRLIESYKNKMKLGYWHGDIKIENILMEKEGAVMIDWAGSLPMQEAVETFMTPGSFTNYCINRCDEAILASLLHSNPRRFEDYVKFIETAHSMDLFALSLVIFTTLTNRDPFYFDEEDYPETKTGIRQSSMDVLIKRRYSENVVNAIVKMLADNPIARYSSLDAIAIWENL